MESAGAQEGAGPEPTVYVSAFVAPASAYRNLILKSSAAMLVC
jgi:hypothetical protein